VITINYNSPLSVRIEDVEDGGFNVHFDEDTLGFNPNEKNNGYSLTPDWNDRHFTLAFSGDSVLYHLTREGSEEERPGEGDLHPEAFISDVYVAIRSIGPVVPADRLEIDEVGKPNFDQIEEYLVGKGVISRTEAGVDINREKQEELVSALNQSIKLKYEFYQNVLDSVSLEDAEKSGENIFVVPNIEEVYLLFFFPDGYVSVAEIREFYTMLETLSGYRGDGNNAGSGSQVMNFLSRALLNQD